MAGQDGAVASSPRSRAAAEPARGEDVSLGPLSGLVGFNLRLAQDASFRAFARHAGQKGLKPGRFAAMMVIHHNPGITQAALGRAIARDKSTVTPLIQELLRRDLVDRQPSRADRRSVTLKLTKAGEAMLADLLQHAEEHDRKLDALVGGSKREFLRLLKKVADGLS